MSGEGGEEDQVGAVETTSPTSANMSPSAITTTISNTASATTITTTPSAQSPHLCTPTPVTTTTTSTDTPSLPLTTITTVTSLTSPPPPATTLPQSAQAIKIKMEDEEGEEEEQSAEDVSCALEQVHLTADQLSALPKEELAEKWLQQEKYVESLHTRMEALEREVEELRGARESEERVKGQLAEAQRKEQYHIMRLSCKEHELQDMGVQVQELKNMSASVGLKHCMLDPAVNLLFERLKRDLDSARTKMEETQNELSAWKFTPDSNTGKQLMAKCRLLIKENEELGRMITSGRLAKLEGDLALQRNFSEELKKSQSELDEFLLEMDEDTEGMQGTIYYLQQQLRQAQERITQLTSQVALTHTPDTQSTDGSSAHIVTEGPSELNNEGERTEERTLLPQPNGDAPHDEARTNSESWDMDATGTPPLTNGRKRTQSEIDEGSELAEGCQDAGVESVSEAEGVPPCKRTRMEGEEEVVGGREEAAAPVVENGVMEAE